MALYPFGPALQPRHHGAGVALMLAALWLSACVTSLDRSAVQERVREASAPRPLVIRTTHGVLEDEASRSLLQSVAADRAQAALLLHMAVLQQGLTGRVLTGDNQTKLLVDGPAAYDAMFSAIRGARHHIHLETYILEDDAVGTALAELLIERATAGVEVRVIYDGFGSIDTSDAYFDRLSRHGVQLYEYRPPDSIEDLRLWRINNRHHRKLLVVDGRTAFTGGINISDVYRSSSFQKSFARNREELRKRKEESAWRDTQIQIVGPAVAELQQLFLELWNEQSDNRIQPSPAYFPEPRDRGSDLIHVIDSAGGDSEVRIYDAMHAVVTRARDRIWITQAYFSPDDALIQDLIDAARRGVDVRMILPGFSDVPLVMHAARSNYEAMLAAGVKIYEREDTVLHAKTMTVDGIWSTVGSSNFDYRSFLHNNEANAVIMGPDFARKMEALFELDADRSMPIAESRWRQRPWSQRLREQAGRLFRYWF